jgi:hypothetical protein
LALITTGSLVLAYAIVAYVNSFVLVPRYWLARDYARYFARLIAVMALFTALVLAIIRTSYFRSLGPDPDPNGLYKHFAIDFLGMAAHLAGTAVVLNISSRWYPSTAWTPRRAATRPEKTVDFSDSLS